jgi:enterochelin esterase-like enzyme
VDMWANRTAYEPTVIERLDAAIIKGTVPPVVLVLPDAWSSYGGSQFLDSPGTGPYQSYICDELVPFVAERFEVHATKNGRAAMGKSSGGYGALMMALHRPDVWGAAGALAPDAAFEYCYLLDFPVAWKTLRQHQGSIDTFWSMCRAKDRPSGDDFTTLNAIAMAACYSPRADGEPDLPWDERTGAVRTEVWNRWMKHDPVRVLPHKLEAARGLRALSIECGLRDEYRLYAGAQMLHTQLNDARIDHRFEFFDGTHASMQHRYPATIAYLATRLGA